MNCRAILPVCCIAISMLPVAVDATGSSAYLGSQGTRALDAKGRWHNGNDYPRNHPPWLDDVRKTVAPEYPYQDRARHNQGVGLFRLTLDLQTGAVMNVSVIRSTGFRTLDDAAITAFRKWQWKSGKWKLIEMPITFRMGHLSDPLPPGARPLPQR
jgi:TonB family protein